ncbi:hypothetical protein FTUN_2137 [Frigoriglobus tundricola]|uniref:Uncharacterized protein n=1 Tax=Frigoriglobus tundricola TaxID=2774151 RepID=A0A6M5YKZ5_9BACT|nr:hypothetical protein FTUN_2137 [Frigoriglobus tundricola]
MSRLRSPSRCPRRSVSGLTSIGRCFVPPCGFTRIAAQVNWRSETRPRGAKSWDRE